MLLRRPSGGRMDFQPIARSCDLAEGHAGLHHAERAGVHAQKNHPLPAAAIPAEIFRMRRPRVSQRIINVRDRRLEFQPVNPGRKFACSGNQLFFGMVYSHENANRADNICGGLSKQFNDQPPPARQKTSTAGHCAAKRRPPVGLIFQTIQLRQTDADVVR